MRRWLALLAAMACSLACSLALAQSPPRAAAAEGTSLLVLDVRLNDEDRGSVLLLERDGQLWVAADDARSWRLLVPDEPGLQYRERRYLALASLQLSVVELDRAASRIVLSAPAAAFQSTQLALRGLDLPVTPAAPGAFLNYDLLGSRFAGRGGIDGAFEFGAFGAHGVFTHQVVRRNFTDAQDLASGSERIATTFRRDWAEQLVSLELGDAVSRPGASGRALRFGGVQLQRNFALRPGFIRQPLPLLTGEAALPSTVEVFVQNQLRSVTSVPAGPFRIDNVPVILGAGEARVVVRDALGRERVLSTPFYAAGGLLRPGLSDFAVAAGRLRTTGGLSSEDYGDGYATALWRQGVSDRLTLEARGEWQESATRVLGASANVGGRFGELEAGVAVADAEAGARWQTAVGYRYDDLTNTVSLRWEQAQRGFRLAGDTAADPTPTRNVNAVVARRLSERVSVAASVIDVARAGLPGTRSFNVSGSFALLRGVALFLTANQVEANGSTRRSAGVYLSAPLGPRTSAYASADGGDDARQSVGIQRSLPFDTGWGGRVGATRYAAGTRVEAAALANTRVATLSVEAVRDRDGSEAARANVAGGIGFVGGSVFAARPIQDSFVLVTAPGVAEAPILLNNQVAGSTDAQGRLLLPRVGTFQPNEIRVDVDALPPDIEIDRERTIVVPPYRSGVVVPLGIRRVAMALVRVVDDAGVPLPAGAAVEADGASATSVAQDGGFFVSGAPGRKAVRIDTRGRRCQLEIELPAAAPAGGAYHRLGPLPCRPVR